MTDLIEEAASALRAYEARTDELTKVIRRQLAATIGRRLGLIIETAGSDENLNPTVEAIISAALQNKGGGSTDAIP